MKDRLSKKPFFFLAVFVKGGRSFARKDMGVSDYTQKGWFYTEEAVLFCANYVAHTVAGVLPSDIVKVGVSKRKHWRCAIKYYLSTSLSKEDSVSAQPNTLQASKDIVQVLSTFPRKTTTELSVCDIVKSPIWFSNLLEQHRSDLDKIIASILPKEVSYAWSGRAMQLTFRGHSHVFLLIPSYDSKEMSFESIVSLIKEKLPAEILAFLSSFTKEERARLEKKFIQEVMQSLFEDLRAILPKTEYVHGEAVSFLPSKKEKQIEVSFCFSIMPNKKNLITLLTSVDYPIVYFSWDNRKFVDSLLSRDTSFPLEPENKDDIVKQIRKSVRNSLQAGISLSINSNALPSPAVSRYQEFARQMSNVPNWFIKREKDEIVFSYKPLTGKTIFSTPFFKIEDDDFCMSEYGNLFISLTKDPTIREKLKYATDAFANSGLSGIQLSRGNGLCLGDSSLSVSVDSTSFSSNFTYAEDSLSDWEAAVDDLINDIKRQHQEWSQSKADSFSKISGNSLATSILVLVSKNSYITENAVVQNLRGLKVQLNARIEDAPFSGKFALVPADTVHETCHDLISSGFLKEKYHKGTYGVFYSLVLTKDGQTYIETADEYKSELFDDFVFRDKIKVLLDSPSKNFGDYVSLLSDSVPIRALSLCMDELQELFMTCPKEVQRLIKMKKAVTLDDHRKKIFGKLLTARK